MLGSLSSARSHCPHRDLEALTTYQCCGFHLHLALPLAHVLVQLRYRKEARAKQVSGLARSELGAGLWCLSGIWAALDEAGPAFI